MINSQAWLDSKYPSIEERKRLRKLIISENEIEGILDLKDFIKLKELNCSKNKLTGLNLTENKQLTKLNCSENQLINLDCKNLIELKELDCIGNKITYLNLNSCSKLEKLSCSFNRIESLNLNNNQELTTLDCSANELTNLQLGKYTNLKKIWCSENQLTDIEFLTKLKYPGRLESLDLSNNNFSPTTLEFLRPFVNLEEIILGTDDEERINQNLYNRFYGSLEPLRNVSRLSELDISATDIDSGLWCLTFKLQPGDFIHSSKRENARCLDIGDPPGHLGAWDRGKRRKNLKRSVEQKVRENNNKMAETNIELTSSFHDLFEESGSECIVPKVEIKEIIREKLNVGGEIDTFETWFNPNCAVVINNKKEQYTIRLIVFEPKHKEMKEILKDIKISKHKNLKEAQKVVNLVKEKLNSDNPILTIYSKNNNDFSPQSAMEKTVILPTKDIETEPDNYLKPFDIIWRKMAGTPNYHAAVYLGNKKVAHISSSNLEVTSFSSAKEGKDKKKKKLFGTVIDAKKNFGANIDEWGNFLVGTKDNLIRHHPVIPFKRTKEIVSHIKKAIFLQYGSEKYNVLFENCEHFATLCVCGVSFSEQADKFTSWFDKIDLEKEIKENNKIFEELKLDDASQEVEEQQSQIQIPPKD